jgi:hypothetical protein
LSPLPCGTLAVLQSGHRLVEVALRCGLVAEAVPAHREEIQLVRGGLTVKLNRAFQGGRRFLEAVQPVIRYAQRVHDHPVPGRLRRRLLDQRQDKLRVRALLRPGDDAPGQVIEHDGILIAMLEPLAIIGGGGGIIAERVAARAAPPMHFGVIGLALEQPGEILTRRLPAALLLVQFTAQEAGTDVVRLERQGTVQLGERFERVARLQVDSAALKIRVAVKGVAQEP